MRACACVGGLTEAALSLEASPSTVHVGGPCDAHRKERGSCIPAAWTTRPSVVVILELVGLAVSGSEVKISMAAIKQCEIETVRTLT